MDSSVANTLVYHHLRKVSPELCHEFTSNHTSSGTSHIDINLEDLVKVSRKKHLQDAVVYNHLLKVAPVLAKEFRMKHPFFETCASLQDLLNRHNASAKKSKIELNHNILKYSSGSFEVITLSEDEVIGVSASSDMEEIDFPNRKSIRRSVEQDFNSDWSNECKTTGVDLAVQTKKLPQIMSESMLGSMSEMCLLSECATYSNLRHVLKQDTVVNRVILHILNKDIKICRLNSEFIILTSAKRLQLGRDVHKIPSAIKVGSFSLAENIIIKSNWKTLVEELNLECPKEVFEEQQLKANILALYLGQGLPKLRLAADVFYHSIDKVWDFTKGHISQTEHNIIMEYMLNREDSLHVFQDLAKLLNRRHPEHLRLYYLRHKGVLLKRGSYTTDENKICIKEILTKSNIKTVLDIKNFHSKEGTVSRETFVDISKQLGRPMNNIRVHLEKFLKPILLQYHAGTLNFDVSQILVNYLVKKNLVHMQDIPWEELLTYPQFAGHNKRSFTTVFDMLIIRTQRSLKCKREEVTIDQIAEFVKEKLDPHKVKPPGKRVLCKLELVDYYRSLIAPPDI